MRASIDVLVMFFPATFALHFIPQAILPSFEFGVDAPRGLQFLFDSRHPWAIENRKKIESSPNPQYDICYGNLRPGYGEVPADFFSTIQINNNRYGIDRSGWKNAVNRIKEILHCPPALKGCKKLEVDIWVTTERTSYNKWYINVFGLESRTPKPEVLDSFTTLFQSMPNLEMIRWNTHDNGKEEFANAFANLTLPSVTHLVPSKNMECMIAMCPNLERLDLETRTGQWSHYRYKSEPIDAMIERAMHARSLTHFGMDSGWTLDRLQTVLSTMSNITSLKIGGWDREFDYGAEFDGWPRPKPLGSDLQDYLDVIQRFPRLVHLRLPPTTSLGVGYNGGAPCGNSYMGKQGRASRRLENVRWAKATERAAKLILPRLPTLETLRIGSMCVHFTRTENGTVTAQWPWEGRLKEWCYEQTPERESFEGEDDEGPRSLRYNKETGQLEEIPYDESKEPNLDEYALEVERRFEQHQERLLSADEITDKGGDEDEEYLW